MVDGGTHRSTLTNEPNSQVQSYSQIHTEPCTRPRPRNWLAQLGGKESDRSSCWRGRALGRLRVLLV